MIDLSYVPASEFARLRALDVDPARKTAVFADLCRLNALYMITRAGSGHIGTSFSCLDLVSWLYLNELTADDVFFSSKGHDAPALYAVLTALGRLPFDKINELRRLNGLPGHPDVSTPSIETNTGSLGMGVSKAKGMLLAKRLLGDGVQRGRAFVLTGDGELQEGQFWESLVSAANARQDNLTVIVDHNKIQSDGWRARRAESRGRRPRVRPAPVRRTAADRRVRPPADALRRRPAPRAGAHPGRRGSLGPCAFAIVATVASCEF